MGETELKNQIEYLKGIIKQLSTKEADLQDQKGCLLFEPVEVKDTFFTVSKRHKNCGECVHWNGERCNREKELINNVRG